MSCRSHQPAAALENWTVTYYDRNGDGIVNYELHTRGNGHATDQWALIDSDFNWRYDLRIHWGDVVEKKKIDLPVPKHVTITPGTPPNFNSA